MKFSLRSINLIAILYLSFFSFQAQSQIITASAEYLPWSGQAVNLFDNNINTSWVITSPNSGWIQIQYTTAKLFNYYKITGNSEVDFANIKRNPSVFNVQGSNDGINWTTLDSRNNILWSKPSEEKIFLFNNAISYFYYRFNVISNQGNSHTQFAELTYSYATPDAVPPTAPAGLTTTTPTTNGFTLSWNPSTDNVGVIAYDVYIDGSFYGTTANTSLYVAALPAMSYAMTVIAKDFYNSSAVSEVWNVITPALISNNYYVAKTGNDVTGNGTQNNPFLTIQKATDMAGMGDIINISEGTYREMVDIKKDLIKYQPYNGEKVILNGADLLTSWTLTAGNTYQTTMAWDVDPTWGSNQVFSDGTMIELARWPDQTSPDIVMSTNALADNITASGGIVTITDADFNEPDGRWNGAKIWMNLSHHGIDGQGWTGTVTSTNQAAHTITLTWSTVYGGNPVLGDVPWGLGTDTEYFLFNPTATGVNATGGVNALLSNGEWWKNGTTLYVKTPNGAAPSTTETGINVIEAKRRHFGFMVTTPKYGYTIKGLNLFGCAITTDNNPWNNRNTVLESAHNIIIDGITAKYVSHQTSMAGNFQDEFYYGSGIVLRGRNNTIQNCNIQYSATAALHVSGAGNKVLNNTIANTNYLCANSGALTTGFICQDAEIANNVIYNTTMMAINLRYAQNSNLNLPDQLRVHHNTIYNFLRRSGDSGAIDNFGQDFQWARIDHNVIYNLMPTVGTMIYGIYLDFAGPGDLSRCTLDHNIIYNVAGPILASSTKQVNVYNNVLISNAGKHGVVNANGSTKGVDVKVYNNIMSREPNVVGQYGYDMSLSDIKNNITNATGAILNTLFVNAVAHDYHLVKTATDAIDKGISVGIYDDNVVGLPDLGAFEFGGSNDNEAPSIPTVTEAKNITDVSFVVKWTNSTDNVAVANYEVYKDGVYYGTSASDSLLIKGLSPVTSYSITVKSRDNSGNSSALSLPLLVTTIADVENPTTPTLLKNTIPTTGFILSWDASTDNIGVTAYEVYKNDIYYGTSTSLSMFITCVPSEYCSMSVKARDAAGNFSPISNSLVVSAVPKGLYAYEGFVGNVNSGSGWAGKWNRTPPVSAAGLTFGSLTVDGDKFGGPAIYMIRPIYLGVSDGDSLCISYLCYENSADVSLVLSSASGGISIRNGKFKDNVVGGVQENSYTTSNLGGAMDGIFSTPALITGNTTFNFLVIKRTGLQFQLKRWVFGNDKLPAAMPVIGDSNAIFSGEYTSNELGFLEITGIQILCKNGIGNVYFDELRLGSTFFDVVPQFPNGISDTQYDDNVKIYTQNNGIVIADLSEIQSSCKIIVYNIIGVAVQSITSNGNKLVPIKLPNIGIYLVSVQYDGKQVSKKVIW